LNDFKIFYIRATQHLQKSTCLLFLPYPSLLKLEKLCLVSC